jgi:hypothetical protein
MIYKTDKPKKQQPKPNITLIVEGSYDLAATRDGKTRKAKAIIHPPAPMIVPIDPDEWPDGHAPIVKDEADGG